VNRSGLHGGFWRCPRWLGDELYDHRLGRGVFTLVAFVGTRREADCGGEGWPTTEEQLATVLRTSPRSARRWLKAARDAKLLDSDIRQGVRSFRLWLGPRLTATRHGDFGHDFGHEEGGSVAEVTSATLESRAPLNHSVEARSGADPLRPPRARVRETETDTRTTPLAPLNEGGTMQRATAAERRPARFARQLAPELRERFAGLDAATRAAIAGGYGSATGLRLAHGTHGRSWRADPLGDHTPASADRGQLPPDSGRPTPAEYLLAWLRRDEQRAREPASDDSAADLLLAALLEAFPGAHETDAADRGPPWRTVARGRWGRLEIRDVADDDERHVAAYAAPVDGAAA